ncbi:MAG: malonyl-ACP O-methyltransferase BioC [Candidatus Omnitrophica bacterium]|nr:malonyl-ACP O-methyltransferase BioC [Candidatus Omnitrophota bacterium]
MIDKVIIKKNFSRSAKFYDQHAVIQNLCALELIKKTRPGSFSRILDIGCGTGNYTRLLKDKFPFARIKAIEISSPMVEIARKKLKAKGIEFILGDGESINLGEQFDLISSNVSFQWFEDLNQALSRYRKLLKKGGVILFSIFGPRTFYELNKALEELCGLVSPISASYFATASRIEQMLNDNFQDSRVERKNYKKRYTSIQELFKTIKYTGARGNGLAGKKIWTSKMLNNLERIYKTKFKEIMATYEVFFCRGVK